MTAENNGTTASSDRVIPVRRLVGIVGTLCLWVCLSAQSQPPSPARGTREGNPPQNQAAAKQAEPPIDRRGTEEAPVIVHIAKSTEETAQDKQDREYEASNKRGMLWLTGLTLFVLIIQSVVLWCQNRIMGRQTTLMRGQMRSTAKAARAAAISVQGLKNSERAYVSIRHRQAGDEWPADIGFHQLGRREGDHHPHRLDVRVVNTGRTPAHVAGGVIQAVRDVPANGYIPPTDIVAERGHITGNFLPAGDWYRQKMDLMLTLDDIQAIEAHASVWLIGFVDYTDAFDTRHRAGFCRRVKKTPIDQNNLFVDRTCEPYNYDRETEAQEKGQPEDQPEPNKPAGLS